MRVEVGVKELRENLAHWLDRAAAGEEILVTERGSAKVLLTPVDPAEAILQRLIREGRVTPARIGPGAPLPEPIDIDVPIMPYLEWARGGPWPGDPEDDPDGVDPADHPRDS